MIPLTKEKRQALIARIADLREEQSSHWTGNYPGHELDLEIWTIALASLEAESTFCIHSSDFPKIQEECGATVWAHITKTDGDVDIYTAPPVPVMKPVKLQERYDIAELSRHPFESYRCIEKDENGNYLRRDDVIAAIKEAGGEVEE